MGKRPKYLVAHMNANHAKCQILLLLTRRACDFRESTGYQILSVLEQPHIKTFFSRIRDPMPALSILRKRENDHFTLNLVQNISRIHPEYQDFDW